MGKSRIKKNHVKSNEEIVDIFEEKTKKIRDSAIKRNEISTIERTTTATGWLGSEQKTVKYHEVIDI